MAKVKNLWEIKQSEKPKTLDIYIYSEIKSDGYDWWTDEVIASETSAQTMLGKIEGYGELDNINIYINSLGGSCLEGHAIYNILKRCKAYKTVYVDGFCCSVASIIAMAGDKVVMPKNTVMIIHNPWTYACGNATELRKSADSLDELTAAFRTCYKDRCGEKITDDELKTMLDDETTLTAENCIKYGFADSYADYNADLEKARADVEAQMKETKQPPKQFAAALKSFADVLEKMKKPEPPKDSEKQDKFAQEATDLFKKYFNTKE